MDILFLLVPVSVLLALGVIALLAWAVWSGQFEDVEKEGERILMGDKKAGTEARADKKTVKPPTDESA
jgi:cbb3-type cytochrome oxidase maturation protein